jgi:hypothetical protein
MQELNKLLGDDSSMASPNLNFAALSLHRLESFNSSASAVSKGNKINV